MVSYKAPVDKTPHNEPTVRLTVAQAVVAFLSNQFIECDGQRNRFFAGCFGIFGHGNVAGIGQALLQVELHATQNSSLRYVLGRNEQAMVHTAVAYARQKNRRQTWAVTASIGPGSTNMLTGAALATINRLPVLLLPSDTFATRVSAPVLQQLELPHDNEISVNDAFKPLSRFFDRVWRPEQLPAALLGAMRVLTDPAETGAATVALPQDVQAEAFDWPESLFAERTWHIDRPLPQHSMINEAAKIIRSASHPLIIAGGGVIYSEATQELANFAEQTGIPVSESQAGKGSLPYNHSQAVGAIGATGTSAANTLAAAADVIIGIGTRYSDFTTASHTAFNNPHVRFVNINITSMDSVKLGGLSVVSDAREALHALTTCLNDYSVSNEYRCYATDLAQKWDDTVTAAYHISDDSDALTQSQVIGLTNTLSDQDDIVVCAAGSMPGDLHKLWRTRSNKGYHVEYGYSCMGYEIAGGIGVRMASPERDVFVMVGDGSYLMMPTELVTAVQEGIKIIVVLIQNHGFASIGSLSESVGSQRFGTAYRYRDASGQLTGEKLPVDLAANAASLGADVIAVTTAAEFTKAVAVAKASKNTTVIHVETNPQGRAPDSQSWWDVPVSQVSELDSTRIAYDSYTTWKKVQRPLITPSSHNEK